MNRRSEAYSYPHVRRPFSEMDRETLASTAVIVEAGVYAEYEMCRSAGEDREIAVLDDRRQLEAVRELGPFTPEEMAAFGEEAARTRQTQRSIWGAVSEIVANHSGGETT